MLLKSLRILWVCELLLLCAFSAISAEPLKLGVICALPKEMGSLEDEIKGVTSSNTAGMRRYVRGKLWGLEPKLFQRTLKP